MVAVKVGAVGVVGKGGGDGAEGSVAAVMDAATMEEVEAVG